MTWHISGCLNGQWTLQLFFEATGLVICTGDSTMMGRIARLTTSTENVETPIAREIERFILIISTIAITLGYVFDILKYSVDEKHLATIVFVIGIIVANVPKGLPLTLTIALTLTAKQTSKKNVLVKQPEGVETLGSTSVICSDKTGTLTMNCMTVAHVYYTFQEFECDTAETQRVECNADSKQFQFRNGYPQVHAIPFKSGNQWWQVSIHKNSNGVNSKNLLLLKGAPENVLGYCDTFLDESGAETPLTDAERDRIRAGVMALGEKGEHVLGFCQLELDADAFPEDFEFKLESCEKTNFPFGRDCERGITFLGLFAMIDPSRPRVPQVVTKCQTASIKVIMVTGDHPVTAKAIAKKVGIIRCGTVDDIAEARGCSVDEVPEYDTHAVVVAGPHLAKSTENVSEGEKTAFWNKVLNKENIVFARVNLS